MNLHLGDCRDVMASFEAESVDAIVTDPPYGLEFMGKTWDKLDGEFSGGGPSGSERFKNWRGPRFYNQKGAEQQAFHARWAEAAYRVAKPSSYLLAFGGTRTVHRMTCAIEDAGWIIRDMLVWAYASGFPKSKASLKPAWEPIVMARKPGPLRMLNIDECRIGTTDDLNGGAYSGELREPDATSYGVKRGIGTFEQPAGRWPANVILTDPIFDGGVEGVVGGGSASDGGAPTDLRGLRNLLLGHDGNGVPAGPQYGDSGTYSRFFVLPKADRADREPILDEYAYRLHRERGECDKLRSWVSADLNRSEPTDSTSPGRATSEGTSPDGSSSATSRPGKLSTAPSPTATKSTTSTATRPTTRSATSSSSTPSRTSDSTPDANSETASGGSPATSAESSSLWAPPTGISVPRAGRSTDDADRATSGSSSSRNVCGRCGKPLPRVGSHPTVKPVDLMRHLVRLVTPPNGVVLDPFLGSGTTALAAEMEGFEWIGIEREPEYMAIAEARLNGTQRGMAL